MIIDEISSNTTDSLGSSTTSLVTTNRCPPMTGTAAFCVVCGRHGYGYSAAPIEHEWTQETWRCQGCFHQHSAGCLFCPTCGIAAGNKLSQKVLGRYQALGIGCGVKAPVSVQQEIDSGLQHLKFVFVFYSVLLATLLGVHWTSSTIGELKADMIGGGVIAIATLFAVAWNFRAVKDLLRFPPQVPAGKWALAIGIPVITVTLAYSQTHLFGIELQNVSEAYFAAGFGPGVVITFIAVMPGIFEEIAFRGVLLHRLREVLPLTQAVIVSSVMFAIIHFSMLGFVTYLIPMALLASWLTITTKSLYPAILTHFLHNLSVVLMEWSIASG